MYSIWYYSIQKVYLLKNLLYCTKRKLHTMLSYHNGNMNWISQPKMSISNDYNKIMMLCMMVVETRLGIIALRIGKEGMNAYIYKHR